VRAATQEFAITDSLTGFTPAEVDRGGQTVEGNDAIRPFVAAVHPWPLLMAVYRGGAGAQRPGFENDSMMRKFYGSVNVDAYKWAWQQSGGYSTGQGLGERFLRLPGNLAKEEDDVGFCSRRACSCDCDCRGGRRESMGTVTQPVVDRYLGPGYFQFWRTQDSHRREELKRTETLERLYGKLASRVTTRVLWDLQVLEKIALDFETGLQRIADGKPVNREQLKRIGDLYTMAVSVVEHENDRLQVVWQAGFVTAWVTFPFPLIQAQATRLQQKIERLKELLEVARREVKESWVQTLIDVAITAITFFLPEVGIVTKLVMAVGSYLIDEALGGDKSPTVDKLDKAGDVSGPALDVVERVANADSKVSKVAGKGGKAISVAGLFFDADEIKEAYEKADKIEAIMKAAKYEFEQLQRTIRSHRPALQRLRVSLEVARRALIDLGDTAVEIRWELKKAIDQYGYSTTKPTQWRAA
jgi:hypothetical protein